MPPRDSSSRCRITAKVCNGLKRRDSSGRSDPLSVEQLQVLPHQGGRRMLSSANLYANGQGAL